MTLLRIWLGVTAAALAILALWAFAPVLVFMALLVAALGLAAAFMILLANCLRAWLRRQ
jgi:hypothetical protein